jgi:GDP/UDP-N,N'-diacetylbacillosamine 2-epimerase (hydrolysing)
VNVGDRQRERARAANVIDVPHERAAIAQALRRAISPEFRTQMNGDSPYLGDGRVSQRIVEILRSTPIDERLLTKQIVY